MKNACASESCPVTPTSSVSPMAAIAADIAKRPVCSQKPSRKYGATSSATSSAISAVRPASRSDTVDLRRSEEPRRPPQQDEQQHDVGDDLAQPAAQERQLVLIAGGERDRHAD